jgi:hypothetical protein
MGIFDFLFGRKDKRQEQEARPVSFGDGPVRLGGRHGGQFDAPASEQTENERALERYRYMLRTAPPETIEQAHAEAFERMTPEQRSYVLQALANELPAGERDAALRAGADPRSLARTATRAELRNAGTMERTLGAHPGGAMGGIGGTLLASFAAGFAGSMVASAFFNAMSDPTAGESEAMPEEMAQEDSLGESDFGGGDFGDFGGGDFGGDF